MAKARSFKPTLERGDYPTFAHRLRALVAGQRNMTEAFKNSRHLVVYYPGFTTNLTVRPTGHAPKHWLRALVAGQRNMTEESRNSTHLAVHYPEFTTNLTVRPTGHAPKHWLLALVAGKRNMTEAFMNSRVLSS